MIEDIPDADELLHSLVAVSYTHLTIDLKFDRALYWVNVGATPSDTARSILSREGVMMMKHLQGGVKKGVFSEEEAQKRFEAWKQGKNSEVAQIKSKDEAAKREAAKKALEAEREVNKAREAALAEKKAEEEKAKAEAEAAAKAEAEAATEAEAPAEEAPATEELSLIHI